ncbi:MAG TPA: PLP-dependent aminotransferase family protein, partial [Ktedonobacterales bacterium]|nr:PLP-dependent aminotransferase family protein [Ktedonobacterales bacterium]
MKRRQTDLLLSLDRADDAAEGLTRQIYAQLRSAILSGRLRAGDRIPPSRVLAQDLDVARLTVATAYEWLQAEGFVYGRVGAGTFVSSVFDGQTDLEENYTHAKTQEQPTSVALPFPERRQAPPVPLSTWARRIATLPFISVDSAESAPYNFAASIGAADAFPWARWRRIVGSQDPLDPVASYRLQVRERATRLGSWNTLLGPPETRSAVASWLRRSRAVRCEPDQVLIAGSVQQMLALLARLLVEPGQRLLVEDPSYTGFHAAFLAEGALLQGIPVDGSGLRVDALPEPSPASAATAARLAIVTPSHQYPTGVTLTLERRVALLEWARRAQVVVVEDDYDGDLRLEGQPLEALRGLDDRDEVIYLGTFAKALYPAVRLAFAVLPHWLVEPVARARTASDRHPNWRDALAVARFIEAGELERHLARMRRLYRARRDVLVAALRENLAGTITIGPAEAGIHLLARLPQRVDDVGLARAARRQGIVFMPLSPHYQGAPRSGMLLGFGALDEGRLRDG